MQNHFVYPHTNMYKKCIKNVVKQIKLAKRRGDYILVVEYVHDNDSKNIFSKRGSRTSPTVDSLKNLLDGYNKKYYVFKNENDGGNEVFETLKKKKIPHRNVRVCGVYADYCVRETVSTLASKIESSKIFLMRKAINCYGNNLSSKRSALKQMSTFSNVKVK